MASVESGSNEKACCVQEDCSPCCSGTCDVDQVGFEHRDLPVSVTSVLELKTCDTTPNLPVFLFQLSELISDCLSLELLDIIVPCAARVSNLAGDYVILSYPISFIFILKLAQVFSVVLS